jgi:hypothetical protein
MVRRPLEKAVAIFFSQPRQVEEMFKDYDIVRAALEFQKMLWFCKEGDY